ncbi:MAG: polysaccharide biosynthesis tyrosine autokinase [Chromatiaceae bacterium]
MPNRLPDPNLSYPLPAGGGQPLRRASDMAMPAFGGAGMEDEKPLDLRRYLGILLHRKWLLIFSVLLALILGLVLTIRETPIYRATAVVEARPPAASPYGYNDYSTYAIGQNFQGDQIQLLKSAALAERVARDFRVEMPATPGKAAAGEQGFFAELSAQFDAWLTRGEQGTPAAEPEPITAEDLQAANQAIVEREIRGGLQVTPVPQANLLSLSLDDENPRRAAALVNAVAKTYVAMNSERRFQNTNKAQDFYDTQVRKTRAELEDLERRLIAYARGKDLVNLENLLETHEQEFSQLKSQIFEVEQRLFQAEAKFRAMQEAGGSGGEDFLKSEVIQQLKTRRAQLDDEYQLNLKVFLPEYPKMVQLHGQIEAIDAQIKEESRAIAKSIEIAYEATRREHESLAQRVAEGRRALLEMRDQTADYNVLKREQTALKAVYDGLMTRIKEAGIVADVSVNNVSILDVASVPSQPYTPNLRANLTKALGLGLVVGVLLIVLIENLDDTVKSAEDAEQLLGVPLLGGYPLVGPLMRQDKADSAATLELLRDPKSPLAEAARSLRATLLFASAEGAPKILHFTSAAPNEGKSIACFCTALAFAKSGASVLCIDADLRNPSLHRLFDVPNNLGLSNHLVSDIQPAEIALATDVEGMYVITSGQLPPNPVELLSSQKMSDLLHLAAERFDYVFVDSPPILGLADAPLLSAIVGATLFVLEPGKTRKIALRDSMKRLQGSHAHVVGAVLQKMDRRGTGYGYGYQYNYQYMYGYGQSAGRDLEPA